MPTKKQRRRREKSFRHDYDYVLVDETGEETPIDPAELRAQKEKERPKSAAKTSGRGAGKTSRAPREAPPPSWRRAFRKGGLWGGGMLVAFVFVFKGAPLPLRLAWGVFYAGAFVPLTYWIDRVAYRSYLKRTGQAAPAGRTKKG